MNKKSNGSSNGHDPDSKNIVNFPGKSERKKLKKQEEEAFRKQYRAEAKAKKRAENPPFFNTDKITPFAGLLCASILVIHIAFQLLLDSGGRLSIIYNFGFIPGAFTGTFELGWSKFISPITYIFIHSGWFHVLVNAFMGLALGLFFERIHGSRSTTLFFLICSLSGALLYALIDPYSTTPVVGASGGISGLFGAVLLTMLRQIQSQPSHYSSAAIVSGQHAMKQRAANLMRKKGPWPIIIFWGVLMSLFGLLSGDNVSLTTHLGGYAAGVLLLTLIQKGKIKL